MLSKLIADLQSKSSALPQSCLHAKSPKKIYKQGDRVDKGIRTNQQVLIPFFPPKLLQSPWLWTLSTWTSADPREQSASPQ